MNFQASGKWKVVEERNHFDARHADRAVW